MKALWGYDSLQVHPDASREDRAGLRREYRHKETSMSIRTTAALTAGLMLALAGTAAGQTTTGGTSGTGTTSGQTANRQTLQRNQQSNQQLRNRTQQQQQQNNTNQSPSVPSGTPAQGAENSGGFFGGSGAFGTRSQGGTDAAGAGTDLGPSTGREPVIEPLDQFQPGVNVPGRINSRFNSNFVQNLTPAERQELSRQLGAFGGAGVVDDGGDGQVNISRSRLNRLNGNQGQDFGAANGYGDQFASPELAEALHRLELLEERLQEQNDMLLRQLGQARQLPIDRQIRAMGDILQDMLQQRRQTLAYMSELRVALAQEAGFDVADPDRTRMTGGRTYAAPERFQGNTDQRWDSQRWDNRRTAPSRDTFDERDRWR
jgi:hypothetical protein